MRHCVAAFLFLAGCSRPASGPPPSRLAAAKAVVVVSPVSLQRPASPVRTAARVVVAREGERTLAIVSDAEAGRVDVVDVDARKEIASTVVDGAAAALLLNDGTIAVGTREAVSILSLKSDGTLVASRTIAVGHDVTAMALAPDDKTLFVAGGKSIDAFEVGSGERGYSVALAVRPSAITIDPDGKHALVTSKTASQAVLVDLAKQTTKNVELDATGQQMEPSGAEMLEGGEWSFVGGMGTLNAIRALEAQRVRARHASAIAPVAEVAYVAHELLVPEGETLEDEDARVVDTYGGGALSSTELLGVSVLDTRTGKRLSVHEAETSCRLPHDQLFEPAKKRLWVACGGTNEVVALTWTPRIENNSGTVIRRAPVYRVAISMALPAPADGIAIDERGRMLASTTWGSRLSILENDGVVKVVALSSDARVDPKIARGRALFHRANDRRISEDGRTCATCHIDGKSDALEWRTKRGMRSTPVLAGRVDRVGAFGWNGESADLRAHIDRTIKKNLAGKGLASSEVDDLAAYVRSMTAPEPTASRGAEVFVASGCATCHTDGGRGTDAELHRLGRSDGSFQTPSLVGLGQSAPYFHDGRYATLEQLLEKTDGKMGSTRGLSPADRSALLSYLKAL